MNNGSAIQQVHVGGVGFATSMTPIPDQTVVDTLDRVQKNLDAARAAASDIMQAIGMLIPGATGRTTDEGILGQVQGAADASADIANWLESIRSILGQRIVMKSA